MSFQLRYGFSDGHHFPRLLYTETFSIHRPASALQYLIPFSDGLRQVSQRARAVVRRLPSDRIRRYGAELRLDDAVGRFGQTVDTRRRADARKCRRCGENQRRGGGGRIRRRGKRGRDERQGKNSGVCGGCKGRLKTENRVFRRPLLIKE